jgi:4-amino-4-deoxy-L-arabinose transferase-like glycosyltransferase
MSSKSGVAFLFAMKFISVVITAWLLLLWATIAAIIILSSGWVIAGAIITWIVSAIWTALMIGVASEDDNWQELYVAWQEHRVANYVKKGLQEVINDTKK